MPVKMGSVGGRDCAVEFVGLTSRQVHAMTKMTDPLTQALRGLFNVGQRLRSRWTLGGPACAARQVWMHTFATSSCSSCCACAPRPSATTPWASCDRSPPCMTSSTFAAARAKQPEVVPCQSCPHQIVRLLCQVSQQGAFPTDTPHNSDWGCPSRAVRPAAILPQRGWAARST